jgi:hypothetical protein
MSCRMPVASVDLFAPARSGRVGAAVRSTRDRQATGWETEHVADAQAPQRGRPERRGRDGHRVEDVLVERGGDGGTALRFAPYMLGVRSRSPSSPPACLARRRPGASAAAPPRTTRPLRSSHRRRCHHRRGGAALITRRPPCRLGLGSRAGGGAPESLRSYQPNRPQRRKWHGGGRDTHEGRDDAFPTDITLPAPRGINLRIWQARSTVLEGVVHGEVPTPRPRHRLWVTPFWPTRAANCHSRSA